MGYRTDLHSLEFDQLTARAAALREAGKGRTISYSPKVFIPLTRLCSNHCGYCGYRQDPAGTADSLYLRPEDVLSIARSGEKAGVTEALVVTGDRPETRYPAARSGLRQFGCSSTPEYAAKICRLILQETRLLPHTNCGVLDNSELAALAEVNASLGLMLESTSEKLGRDGGPHEHSPGKAPARRLAVIEQAGRLKIPFTTGILIGIGESTDERIESLETLHRLAFAYGHIQEVIIQNWRGQESTEMAGGPGPTVKDLIWTIAVARLILGPSMNIQAPPNLALELGAGLTEVIGAGINDWGGISPVTADEVNPGVKWPSVADLRAETAAAGFELRQRFPVYPEIILGRRLRLSALVRQRIDTQSDGEGYVRAGGEAGGNGPSVSAAARAIAHKPRISPVAVVLSRSLAGEDLDEDEIVSLFAAEGSDLGELCAVADEQRRRDVGNLGTYVVNRNINFTNICFKKCHFCGFNRRADDPDAFQMSVDAVMDQVRQAATLGATEVCIQAGLAPGLPPDFYLELVSRIKAEAPQIHIHGVSPEELDHSARMLGIGIEDYLVQLRSAGLDSIPGTSAEILDDEVRRAISPRRISTARWLEIIQTAHSLGIRTSSTMMYGQVETYSHRARHLLLLRELQRQTGGFTEFVPLRFIGRVGPTSKSDVSHLEAAFRGGGLQSAGAPTASEDVLKMHAVARLVLGRSIRNIQVSWVKEGVGLAARCLRAGANDLGGTLMNESISSSAGATNGELLRPRELQTIVRQAGLVPAERSTLYQIRAVYNLDNGGPAHPLDLVDEHALRAR